MDKLVCSFGVKATSSNFFVDPGDVPGQHYEGLDEALNGNHCVAVPKTTN
jgi:hypothetical protein